MSSRRFTFEVKAFRDGELVNTRQGCRTAPLIELEGFPPTLAGFHALLAKWNRYPTGGGMSYLYRLVADNEA